MLSNAYFLAKFRFDTAENEPAKNLQNCCTGTSQPARPLRRDVARVGVELQLLVLLPRWWPRGGGRRKPRAGGRRGGEARAAAVAYVFSNFSSTFRRIVGKL